MGKGRSLKGIVMALFPLSVPNDKDHSADK